MVEKAKPQRDLKLESEGWFQVALIIIAFPVLFMFCVFFPIWMGWTERFP